MAKHRRRPGRLKAYRTRMFEPNRAEIGYFLRRFRGRRRRVKRMLVFGLALPFVLAAVVYMNRDLFFVMGNPYRPSMTAYLALAVLVVIELGIVAMAFYYWRCAHCEAFAGFRWDPDVCTQCGAKLRRSRRRPVEPDDYEDDDEGEEERE
jgi:hypothetical protein